MDYEKAYKNLVAKVKNAHLYAQTDSTKNVLEDILPELRESEDERIRKKCIELIKRVIPSGDSQSQESKEILDCIAYLEKKKEPTKEELYIEAGTTEKEYIANTMKMVRAMREKKQEQKPDIELIQRSWYMEGYNDRDFFMEPKWILKTGEGGPKYEPNPRYGKSLILGPEPCCCSVNEHKAGLKDAEMQKPAEKQDYSGLNDLERAIHRGFLCAGVENVPVGIIKETAKECITQMKPAEWSEEDEKMLQNLLECLKNGWTKLPTDVLMYESWLKSLRPSWKPSEEQMNVLRKLFIEGVKALTQTDCNTLNSIYLDLKKLM